MNKALIGYTGFVGQNLLSQHAYSQLFNSKNIGNIEKGEFEFLVCAGVPAEMYLANSAPEKDWAQIETLMNLLKTVRAQKAVLVSTIAVYPQLVDADETSLSYESSSAYGKHRRRAEELFQEHFRHSLVVRLPSLFGPGLKKNFLFDILHLEPAFLTPQKLEELSQKSGTGREILKKYYIFNEDKNMFAYCKPLAENNKARPQLKKLFQDMGFTSLQFTHKDSMFQFYNILNLHEDIQKALNLGIKELNICSTPVSPKEIMNEFFQTNFDADSAKLFSYNMKSIHAAHWKNKDYLYSKGQVFADLRKFFKENRAI